MNKVTTVFGAPDERINEGESTSLVFVERKRSALKGALIGGGSFTVISLIPASILAPFTFGLSFIIVPIATVVGGLGGAIVGAFHEVDTGKLIVDFDADGKLKQYQFIPIK